tara:strand:+ start:2097 stop:2687 length:591 start_codon:yes stop_codon:yes gene_type:complete
MSRTRFIDNIGSIGASTNSKGVSIFGCSFYSMYTPVFAIFKDTQSLLQKDYCIYHHKVNNLCNYAYSNYDNIIFHFINRNSPFNYKHKHGNYNIRKGIITDENNNVLLCICFKSYKKIINSDNVITNNDLIVLVDKSFEKSLLYKNLYKRELFLDMDILVTSNVSKYCFNSGNIIPKFKNINAMQDYFNDVNKLMK